MTVQNKNAGTAATVPAKKQTSPQKGEVMNQTIRTTIPEIKCARCMCPPGTGETFIHEAILVGDDVINTSFKIECNCPCHCHDGIPPAQSPTPERHTIGGELARIVYGPGGLASRIRANRNACTCEVPS